MRKGAHAYSLQGIRELEYSRVELIYTNNIHTHLHNIHWLIVSHVMPVDPGPKKAFTLHTGGLTPLITVTFRRCYHTKWLRGRECWSGRCAEDLRGGYWYIRQDLNWKSGIWGGCDIALYGNSGFHFCIPHLSWVKVSLNINCWNGRVVLYLDSQA